MAKSVLKKAKHLLKRSLATSIALVVAMVAISLSLATKIAYAEKLTSTNPEITVNGNFGGSMHTLKVTEFPLVNGDNSTYDTLKGCIEPSYEEFKTWELTVDPTTNNTDDITITFTLGDEYNGREARVLYCEQPSGAVQSVDGTVADGKLTVTVKNLETFMITLKQAAAAENAPGTDNNENGTGDDTNGDTSDNDNDSKTNSKGNVKTGDSTLALIISSIGLLTLSAAGLLIFKKKYEARHFN